MSEEINADQLRDWIDNELIEEVERIPDEAAEFNLMVEMSNMPIHVIRRQPNGPLIIGQQIEYDNEIRTRIGDLSEAERNDLVARIRETLTTAPIVYGFHDERGSNVQFEDMQRILLERRLYPCALNRQMLMNGLIDIWKTMRYLDDIMTLIDSVKR